MILDHISHWRQYAAISPRFQAGFGFLEKLDGGASPGRYDIDGNNLYALVQKYTTKSSENREFEAHQKYLDIQYLHSGLESILWAPLPALSQPVKPYDEKTEAAMYPLVPNPFPINLSAGLFTVLFPGDGHVPGCIWNTASQVLKVVVKVKI
jgi:biofilm protein TabA